jgi:hypothetical protein
MGEIDSALGGQRTKGLGGAGKINEVNRSDGREGLQVILQTAAKGVRIGRIGGRLVPDVEIGPHGRLRPETGDGSEEEQPDAVARVTLTQRLQGLLDARSQLPTRPLIGTTRHQGSGGENGRHGKEARGEPG